MYVYIYIEREREREKHSSLGTVLFITVDKLTVYIPQH